MLYYLFGLLILVLCGLLWKYYKLSKKYNTTKEGYVEKLIKIIEKISRSPISNQDKIEKTSLAMNLYGHRCREAILDPKVIKTLSEVFVPHSSNFYNNLTVFFNAYSQAFNQESLYPQQLWVIILNLHLPNAIEDRDPVLRFGLNYLCMHGINLHECLETGCMGARPFYAVSTFLKCVKESDYCKTEWPELFLEATEILRELQHPDFTDIPWSTLKELNNDPTFQPNTQVIIIGCITLYYPNLGFGSPAFVVLFESLMDKYLKYHHFEGGIFKFIPLVFNWFHSQFQNITLSNILHTGFCNSKFIELTQPDHQETFFEALVFHLRRDLEKSVNDLETEFVKIFTEVYFVLKDHNYSSVLLICEALSTVPDADFLTQSKILALHLGNSDPRIWKKTLDQIQDKLEISFLAFHALYENALSLVGASRNS